MLKDLIRKNRSYRRFKEADIVKRKTMVDLINFARQSASLANRQPLKYILSNEPKKNSLIFSCLSWAGYLQDWQGPEQGERPSAYIILLGDKKISENCLCDAGIAVQSILLGATEKGLGGCILGAVDREKLRQSLEINDRFDILYVLALGKPAEEVRLEEVDKDGDIKYWRDSKDIHHVPKRPLNKIIL